MRFYPRFALACSTMFLIAGCASNKGADAPNASQSTVQASKPVQADLVPLASVAPSVKQDMRYFTRHNFMGKPINGYEAGVCWLSRDAAMSLAAV